MHAHTHARTHAHTHARTHKMSVSSLAEQLVCLPVVGRLIVMNYPDSLPDIPDRLRKLKRVCVCQYVCLRVVVFGGEGVVFLCVFLCGIFA